MQLKYSANLLPPVDGMQKVSAVTWSTNGKRLAVSTADRYIHLFDQAGQKRDKFPTKPSDKGQKSYVVRAVEFSPDSQKIAIAQSDNIVYVYKIGTEWGDKKSICNQFPTSSSVTCLTWPGKSQDIVFGLAQGRVRSGVLRTNKSQVLYSTDSYVVSLSSSRDGENVISGHIDGSIYAFNMENQTAQKVVVHHSIPYALGWGEQIVAAGNDAKVSYYDTYGNLLQRFDYSTDDKVREFTLAAFNPSGDTVVLGNFNRFYVYNYNQRRGQWDEIGVKHIDNYYTVTALCWKNDGSKLVTGSLCGSVDLYDASMKKIKYKGKFELNYVSPSQVVVKTLLNGRQTVVRSNYASEISKINIYKDRFVVANTYETICIGDLETEKVSEIQWRGSGNEQYDFTNPNVCMVFNAGELTLIEYGNNEPLGTIRTEHMKSRLISARLNYIGGGSSSTPGDKGSQVIAYLLDTQTICITDLNNNTNIGQINHDSKVDFLELNPHGNKLLFRDKQRQLHLYNIKQQSKNTLLSYSSYAQWVPESDVVVAQNRNNLCVWYSIENPDQVTIYNIKGDVETIERTGGKTEVIVNEGNNTVAYSLQEPLIEFGFAIENNDLEKAANILDPIQMNPQTEANWKTLAKLSLENQNIIVAEHCYAALGDISKASYLRKINKMIYNYEKENNKPHGQGEGIQFYKVQARLAILDKQFHRAEALLVEHNEIEEAMELYQELHKWDESIKIAETGRHPDLKDLKANYFQWLIDSNQEAQAAEVKENQGDFLAAINLFLKASLPARAANIVYNYNVSFPSDALQKIATALSQSGMYERAGQFYQQMEIMPKALDCYVKGNSFKKAVELAKQVDVKHVVALEQKWGDWLVSQKQTENAVNHYIEAGAAQQAIEASIASRQWNKAIQLLQHQTPEVSRPFYKQIAKHYSDVRQYDFAEKYYQKAGIPLESFEMYAKASKWDQAYRVARDNFSESEIIMMYVKQGQKFEEKAMFKEAEKLYLTVQQFDYAINMYQKAAQVDNIVRLVARYKPNSLKDTHLSIAQKFEREGNFKLAEHHYIEATAWHGAVEMYKSHNMWEEAVRCCKLYGSDKETCELAKQWAETLGPEQGQKMLLQMNLVDAVIEYLSDRNEFEQAFKMAKSNAKHKLADVHLKYGFHLEDEKRYKEAEENFIKAGKPDEAINMFEHLGDFQSALLVAKQYEPNQVNDILMTQAKMFREKREFAKAENCYVMAKKIEMAIHMYIEMGQFSEAIKVAQQHAPHLVEEINNKYKNQSGISGISGQDLFEQARTYEQSRNWNKAIETYLEMKREIVNDTVVLQEAWDRAIQLCLNYSQENALDTVRIVAKRLKDMQRFEPAASHLENVGLYEQAATVWVMAERFDRAKDCASQIQVPDTYNQLMKLIDQHETQFHKQHGRATDLVAGGKVGQGLDMLSANGEWKQCLELAEKQGGDVLTKYLMKFAKSTMENSKYGQTIAGFARFGMQPIPSNYPIYKTLALEIFVECEAKEIQNLRTALYNFFKILQGTGDSNSPAGREFGKYLVVAHLLNLKTVYENKGMHQLHAKLCIAILRYCDLVRLDKLYYDAGAAAQKQNWLSYAFVLYNRYIDIYQVIQDPDSNPPGDNTDFQMTDIPSPFDVPLPEQNLQPQQKTDQIRDWVLQLSMNSSFDHSLPLKPCEKCGTQIGESTLKCPKCAFNYEPCIITGFPLYKGSSIPCRSCNKHGLKDAWSLYLQNFANCPWCNNSPN